MSSGTSAGFVSVSVTVTNGKCKLFLDYEDWTVTCTQFKACTQSTSSTWSSIEAGSLLDLCVQAGDGVTRCDAPPVTVGASGAGSSLMSTQIPCGSDGASGLVYSVVSESGGLSASATVSCSACES